MNTFQRIYQLVKIQQLIGVNYNYLQSFMDDRETVKYQTDSSHRKHVDRQIAFRTAIDQRLKRFLLNKTKQLTEILNGEVEVNLNAKADGFYKLNDEGTAMIATGKSMLLPTIVAI